MTVAVRRVVIFLAASFLPILLLPALLAQDLESEPGGPEENDGRVRVIHVEGSHYEAGYQLGTQLKANLVKKCAGDERDGRLGETAE